jgi:hypothetical protein
MCIGDDEYICKRVIGMEIGKRGRSERGWFDCIRDDMIALVAHTEDALDR